MRSHQRLSTQSPAKPKRHDLPDGAELHTGLVVSTHGRHCFVETPEGRRLICHPRGKKSEVVVGDRVTWHLTQEKADEGVIVHIEERRNLLYRQDEWRSKSFAANLDLLLIWIAVEPVFSEAQLTRALIATEVAGIAACIVLNKTDLPGTEVARQRLQPYRAMGYEVIELSLTHQGDAAKDIILPKLRGRASLVLGPSGAGKSTLINTLAPHARAEVGEISQALNSGKHTTTHSTWYWVEGETGAPADHRTAVIDSPGFQEFGLHHVTPVQLPHLMPDIARHATECRFSNCTHRQEPGCGVQAAVKQGLISPMRISLYTALFDELSQTRW
ncbi:MAG: ribosome small subunit-dependent GTPase A [Burkholderiales bacterium]|nr:ribosome small subunit-dependent GTPase A [Burkholderiales bacterium]